MILTDTHTHLYYVQEQTERKAQIRRCLDAHVNRLFLPCVDASNIPDLIQLSDEYPQHCFSMLGLHPCQVTENYSEEIERIKAARSSLKIYAIGEIGIDLYWDKSLLALQQRAFHEQIIWAKQEDLPIVIHCREAFNQVFEVLEEHRDDKLKGIMHCFSGNIAQAEKVIELGFMLGIGGVVTYKNSGLDQVVNAISLDNIVLETDAPYLTPVPHRGKKNESAYLTFIAQKIADIKHVSLEEIAEITTANSIKVFGI